jgi:ElaB/YqjD/DUF883 family membrane-anchored ribosome-binding protein
MGMAHRRDAWSESDVMAQQQSATARDIAEIGRLLRELEARFESLGGSAKADAAQAGGAAADMLSDALLAVTERVRETARSASGEAARVGSDAVHRIESEIGHRPFAMLAVAAGIGFLLGYLNRR